MNLKAMVRHTPFAFSNVSFQKVTYIILLGNNYYIGQQYNNYYFPKHKLLIDNTILTFPYVRETR